MFQVYSKVIQIYLFAFYYMFFRYIIYIPFQIYIHAVYIIQYHIVFSGSFPL